MQQEELQAAEAQRFFETWEKLSILQHDQGEFWIEKIGSVFQLFRGIQEGTGTSLGTDSEGPGDRFGFCIGN